MRCAGFFIVGVIVFCSFSELKAQDQNTSNTQVLSSSTLTYKPEIPAPETYQIVKNTTGAAVPDSVLLMINAKRKLDEQVEWKVNDELELIIFPIKPKGDRNDR